MAIKEALQTILNDYVEEKRGPLKGNVLAQQIRRIFPKSFQALLSQFEERYLVYGSAGQGNWADCPWIGIFDATITTSAQQGYYLVYLFEKEMQGVYLSFNQGVTSIKNEYKRCAQKVLVARAEEIRQKIKFLPSDKTDLLLQSELPTPQLYEKGNILAKYYSKHHLPEEKVLVEDFERFLSYYQKLLVMDTPASTRESGTIEEIKRRRLHDRFDRAGTTSSKVKKRKGYVCEACDFSFEDNYGDLGSEFIEAHHLVKFSSLDEGVTQLNLERDFTVLCSNCHRMIHRLSDSSNVEELKRIIEDCKSRKSEPLSSTQKEGSQVADIASSEALLEV